MEPNSSLKQNRCLAMMVRHPEPGKVKTRLAMTFGNAFAADLYECFVEDLLATMAPGDHHLEIFFTPAEKSRQIRQRFGIRFNYMPQEGGDLGERMENACRSCFADGFAAVIVIGSDIPDLTLGVIEDAFQAIESGESDAVIGPALDGGYYLIGFRADAFVPGVFRDILWGEGTVCETTLNRLRDAGCRIHLAPIWRDIDTEEDLTLFRIGQANSTNAPSRTMAFLRNR